VLFNVILPLIYFKNNILLPFSERKWL